MLCIALHCGALHSVASQSAIPTYLPTSLRWQYLPFHRDAEAYWTVVFVCIWLHCTLIQAHVTTTSLLLPLSIILSTLKAISCMQIKQIKSATDPLFPSFLNRIHAYAYAYACGLLHRITSRHAVMVWSHTEITAQRSCLSSNLLACHTALHHLQSKWSLYTVEFRSVLCRTMTPSTQLERTQLSLLHLCKTHLNIY